VMLSNTASHSEHRKENKIARTKKTTSRLIIKKVGDLDHSLS